MEDRLELGEEFEMDGATRPPYFGTEVGEHLRPVRPSSRIRTTDDKD